MSDEIVKGKVHEKQRSPEGKQATWLIALCWLVYACSYIGKLGYNANITKIETLFAVSHAKAGMVSTFFFFAYGVGQIINGLFCKKYNLRYVVLGGLVVSATMNWLVGITSNFTLLKYFWLVNGAALSVLWTSLIRLLSETLNKKSMSRAVFIMGTTVATGTFLVYGLSAAFVAFDNFRIIFYVAGSLLPIIALIWWTCYPYLTKKMAGEEVAEKVNLSKNEGGRYALSGLFIVFVIFAFFAISNNLIKDGLTTWVPMILKDLYGLPDYASILLTLCLPVLAVFGATLAVYTYKKLKNFVMMGAFFFLVATILVGVVILFLPQKIFVVTIICFALVACLMAAVNNVVTSMMPLFWKDKINSGKVAGILNGFCYLGSTLSSYGLGVVADAWGWLAVLWLLFGLAAAAAVIGWTYAFLSRAKKEQKGV